MSSCVCVSQVLIQFDEEMYWVDTPHFRIPALVPLLQYAYKVWRSCQKLSVWFVFLGVQCCRPGTLYSVESQAAYSSQPGDEIMQRAPQGWMDSIDRYRNPRQRVLHVVVHLSAPRFALARQVSNDSRDATSSARSPCDATVVGHQRLATDLSTAFLRVYACRWTPHVSSPRWAVMQSGLPSSAADLRAHS